MAESTALAVDWVEQGLVPDRVVRLGIRRLLRQRLAELRDGDPEAAAALTQQFVDALRAAPDAPLALLPEKANAQHYELPAAFFGAVLGPHRKYSSCYWGRGTDGANGAKGANGANGANGTSGANGADRSAAAQTLEQAEAAALAVTCERAGLAAGGPGQDVLELGCGWGSLSLWMAARYPASRFTALSNSASQRAFIEAEAGARGIANLQVITRDINDFDTAQQFDRVVSVEMFEHLHNWPRAFANVARWLKPDGRFFMHVFAHRGAPYAFVERDASDWMSRHFFSGGIMPSDDLALLCQRDLQLQQRWRWDGTHYQRTAEAWLANMDAARNALMPLLQQTYGGDAERWWMRWRLFFLSVSELFGFDGGRQWWVSHYLFCKRA